MRNNSTTTTTRILVITLSNIGDAVMTTPVIVALRQQYPDASIDIVTDARASGLFEHMPGRGTVFLKDKSTGWRGTARLVKQLRLRRYDLVVDLVDEVPADPASAELLASLSAALPVGIDVLALASPDLVIA